MNKLLILSLCLFLAACTGGDRGPVIKPAKSITDSIDKAFATADTLSVDSTGPSPAQILKACLNNYKTVTTVDTIMVTDSGALHIHLKHYCTYDGGIILPEKYTKPLRLKTLATNNFATDVVISRNQQPVYMGRITKDDFLPLVDESLKNYGALISMGRKLQLSRSRLGIVINYSFSIPLTDVGQMVTIALEPTGAKQVFVNYGYKAEKAYPDSVKVRRKNSG